LALGEGDLKSRRSPVAATTHYEAKDGKTLCRLSRKVKTTTDPAKVTCPQCSLAHARGGR